MLSIKENDNGGDLLIRATYRHGRQRNKIVKHTANSIKQNSGNSSYVGNNSKTDRI